MNGRPRRPGRCCRKSTGEPSLRRTNRATAAITGDDKISTGIVMAKSRRRFPNSQYICWPLPSVAFWRIGWTWIGISRFCRGTRDVLGFRSGISNFRTWTRSSVFAAQGRDCVAPEMKLSMLGTQPLDNVARGPPQCGLHASASPKLYTLFKKSVLLG